MKNFLKNSIFINLYILEDFMKVRASIKRLCKECFIVKRKRVLFVLCKIKKHKQRQG